jgi:hypothetical protein
MSERLRTSLAALAEQARPVDLHDRVLRGARRRTRRAWTAAVMAMVGLTTGAVATVAALRPPPPVVPTPLPTMSANPEPSPSPTVTPEPPEPDHPTVDFANATFDVPEFVATDRTCPAGRRSFVDGVTRYGDWSQWLEKRTVVWGDLDGRPGDEAVVGVNCTVEGPYPLLPLVLRVGSDGSITTVGWAALAGGEPLMVDPYEPWTIADRTLQVRVVSTLDRSWPWTKQRRGYTLRDGAVVQVSGPTTLPASTDLASFDPANATLRLDLTTGSSSISNGTGLRGWVSLVGGRGQAFFGTAQDDAAHPPVPVEVTVEQVVQLRLDGQPRPAALLRVTPAGAPAMQLVIGIATEFRGSLNRVILTRPGEVVRSIAGDGDNQIAIAMTVDGVDTTRRSTLNHTYGDPRWTEPA